MGTRSRRGSGDTLGCLVVATWLALFAPALYFSTFADLDKDSAVRIFALAASRYLVAAAFFGGGVACASFVVAQIVQRRRRLDDGIRVMGRVDRLHERIVQDTKSSVATFAPVVTFTAPDGTTHTFTSAQSDNRSPYKVGHEVVVLCRPSAPWDPELEAVVQSLLFIVAGGVLAVMSVAIGTLVLILR